MKKLIYRFLLVSVGVSLGFWLFKKTPSMISGGECKSPIPVYQDPARIPWRNFLREKLGDLSGKTISGTGFYAFEMAKPAERVYATELDPLFLTYLS